MLDEWLQTLSRGRLETWVERLGVEGRYERLTSAWGRIRPEPTAITGDRATNRRAEQVKERLPEASWPNSLLMFALFLAQAVS